jgi:transposase
MTTSPQKEFTFSKPVLYMAIELSADSWKLAFADGFARRPRMRNVCPASAHVTLPEEIARAKVALDLPADAAVVSCYEAGRDAFWVHRWLLSLQVKSYVVEPASIEVDRRKRRAKTDRIDAQKIVHVLMRYEAGDRHACRMVRIPDADVEDARNLHRELETLKSEKTAHSNRIKGLLQTQGIACAGAILRNFKPWLSECVTGDGRRLGLLLTERLNREFDRLALVVDQIRGLEMQQIELLRNAMRAAEQADQEAARREREEAYLDRMARTALALTKLTGIGTVTAMTLSAEVFAWRDIANRRQLGALAGLTPTPFASGDSEREQGVSKSGRSELRSLLIEIAWGWLKFQPDSALTRWYEERFDDRTSRNRKRGIVALARKLLLALGKLLRSGEVPEGARLKDTLFPNYTASLQPRMA